MPILRAQPRPSGVSKELARVLKLHVPVIVKLAEKKIGLAEVLKLQAGSILEFDKSSDQPLELMIANKTIAVGDAVKVGENFGLRIKQIGDVREIIRSMAS